MTSRYDHLREDEIDALIVTQLNGRHVTQLTLSDMQQFAANVLDMNARRRNGIQNNVETFPVYLDSGPNDVWTVHAGGPCPVRPERTVAIRLRRGDEWDGQQASSVMWGHSESPFDVVAYRVRQNYTFAKS